MSAPRVLRSNKSLSSVAKEDLPPTPHREDPASFSFSPPQLPPKFIPTQERPPHPNSLRPLAVDVTLSNELLGRDLNPSPATSSSPSSPDGRAKRSNPLVDLIETEKLYVEQLTGIIRKVASAWSRTNLPPYELDLMFRSMESVYKADRSLLSRLKDIGSNPASPKALGDLLMRWISELEAPYTSYCERYCVGFDVWEPVCNNTRLPDVLAAFSATLPPPNTSSADPGSSVWTLDELFFLPKGRLRYFKKLYGRLLKGTQPGRSDYKLLAGAAEKLDKLLSVLDTRANIKVGSSTPAALEIEDEVVVDLRSSIEARKMQEHLVIETATGSETSSARGSGFSSAARSSNDTSVSSIERGPAGDLLITLDDLESRLAVDRCLDIFTMKPRPVRLQILPPSLPYARTMRIGVETTVRFVSRSTGVGINHPDGRVFILSDLFLLCERMAPGERSVQSPRADMWLLYPPLAGKHLKVAKVEDDECALEVTIMRKENLILAFSSPAMRERALSALSECIEFGSVVHGASKHPLPPMPTPNAVLKPQVQVTPGDGIPSSQTAPDLHQSSIPPQSSRSPSPHRVSSPISSLSGSVSRLGSGPPSRNSHDTAPGSSMSLTNNMSSLVHSLEAQIQQGGGWAQPVHDPHSGQKYPARQPSQTEASDNSVGYPRFAGGTPLSLVPNSQGPPPQLVAPIPGGGLVPGQVISPGQFLPIQRAASADQLGRRGPPPVQTQQPMHGADPSFAQRGPQRLPPNPLNSQFAPPNPPYVARPGLPPSDPSLQGGLRKSPSAVALTSQQGRAPPFDGPLRPGMTSPTSLQPRAHSLGPTGEPQLRAILPSAQFRAPSMVVGLPDDPSPPTSPTMDRGAPAGPVTSVISAQMKCKVFSKQSHAQWKSLGSAKLKLYHEQPTNVKQLVVEAEDRNKSVLISTIVLTDGVERVGKTGIAVELSDKGARTGIIYMIQLRNEQAAVGLYEGLLAGSDRTVAR
ncbi:hypothetical protein BJV78DRAFT_1293883 [Lactifluus subvellereus]|nr:hypothetical protein BJV78DRAFT_1293883 [Lactifluus subvellereus]